MPTLIQSQQTIRDLLSAAGERGLMPEQLDISNQRYAMAQTPGVIDPDSLGKVGFRGPAEFEGSLVSRDPNAVSRAGRLAGDTAQKQMADMRRSTGAMGAMGGQAGAAMGGSGNLAAMSSSRAMADEAARQEQAVRQELLSKQGTMYQQDIGRRAGMLDQMQSQQQEEYNRLMAERSRRIQEDYALREVPLSVAQNMLQLGTKFAPGQLSLPTGQLVSAESSAAQQSLAERNASAQASRDKWAQYAGVANVLTDVFGNK
jgi:hypothetical protein